MDVVKALGELYSELKRVNLAIGKLERQQSEEGVKAKSAMQRGRKSMSSEERKLAAQGLDDYAAGRSRGLDRSGQAIPDSSETTGIRAREPRSASA